MPRVYYSTVIDAPADAVWACRTLAATHYASGGWSVGAVALVPIRYISGGEDSSAGRSV